MPDIYIGFGFQTPDRSISLESGGSESLGLVGAMGFASPDMELSDKLPAPLARSLVLAGDASIIRHDAFLDRVWRRIRRVDADRAEKLLRDPRLFHGHDLR